MSAPHSSTTIFDDGVSAGRMAALGVTITSARAADALAPPPHRLDDQRAIEDLFWRAWIVDHRRVDFEHRPDAERRARENAFAAEVVVALDDGVGTNIPQRDAPPRAVRAQRSSFRPSGGAIAIQRTGP